MSNVSGTIRGKATLLSAMVPTIYNVSAPLANTEYSQLLNDSTKIFTIKNRNSGNLRIAFNPGDTSTDWIEIPVGCSFTQESVLLSATTIYFMSNKASQMIEILEWV